MSVTLEEIALIEFEIASLRLISEAALHPCIRQVARQRLAEHRKWLEKLRALQLEAPDR